MNKTAYAAVAFLSCLLLPFIAQASGLGKTVTDSEINPHSSGALSEYLQCSCVCAPQSVSHTQSAQANDYRMTVPLTAGGRCATLNGQTCVVLPSSAQNIPEKSEYAECMRVKR